MEELRKNHDDHSGKYETNSIKYTNIQPNGWEWESGFLLQYHGYYPWESCFDFGRNISNSIAYKSGNESITNGYPDMPDASFSDQKWFIDCLLYTSVIAVDGGMVM